MTNTKEYFDQTFTLDKKIERLTEKVEVLRHRATSPTGGIGDGLGVQISRVRTSSQDLMVKILTIEDELNEAKNQLLNIEENIRQMTQSLPPIPRAIITWRYICRLLWSDVAKASSMSEMQAMRIAQRAVAPSPTVIRLASKQGELRINADS